MLKSQVADSIQDFVFFFSLNKTDLITQTESGRMETVITTTQKQTVDDTRTLRSMYSCCDKSKKKVYEYSFLAVWLIQAGIDRYPKNKKKLVRVANFLSHLHMFLLKFAEIAWGCYGSRQPSTERDTVNQHLCNMTLCLAKITSMEACVRIFGSGDQLPSWEELSVN